MIEQLRQQILKLKNISRVRFTDEEIISPEIVQILQNSLTEPSPEDPQELLDMINNMLPVIKSGPVRLWNRPTDFSGKYFNECSFINIDMSQWDLTDTFFSQCVFDHVILPVELNTVTLRNCSIKDSHIAGKSLRHNFRRVKTYDCEFVNTDLSSADTAHCEFSTTNFENCDFSVFSNKAKTEFFKCGFKSTSFINSNLNHVTFEEFTDAENVNFSGSTMRSSMLTGLQITKDNKNCIDGCDLTCANLSQSVISGVNPKTVILDRTVFSDSSFKNVRFERLNLSCVWLSLCTLEACVFDHCNLSNAKFDGSAIKNVVISDCLAPQLFADNMDFSSSSFCRCILDFSSMCYATFTESSFLNCSMKLINLHDIKKLNSSMQDCDMTDVRNTDPLLYKAEHFY